MDIGIGLPAAVPGVPGPAIAEWARRAEQRGFSSLGVIDRVVYGNYEPLVALAAAAAVTERIRLTTSILLAPLRTNHVLFAKQVASVDRLSEGRLVLGIGVGRRENDYADCSLAFRERGRELDAVLQTASEVWRERPSEIGARPGGPTLMFGGDSPAAYRRMARYGAGWIAGGGFGNVFRAGAAKAREAWTQGGREGAPRLVALGYFALGAGGAQAAHAYLTDYYAFTGPFAEQIAAGALTAPSQISDRLAEFSDAGCDELILLPCTGDPDQVGLLADAVGL